MPFTIPNAVDAEDGTQAQVDSRDFRDIIVAAFGGTGCVSGCAVTAQGAPNMTVAVAAGNVAVAGASVAVTGGNVTITTANATNPRFDLICVDSGGVKSAVAGVASATPVFPDPAGKVVLAAVRVPANAASINAAKIVDKRVAPVITPSVFPVGFIGQFAGTVAPSGWWLCDGSAISRTTYAVLFALVGVTFGAGDGSTTFNVPDIAGRNIVGLGSHTDVNAIGKTEGVALPNRTPKHNSSAALTLPNHVHSLTDGTHAHSISDPGHAHGISDPGHMHIGYNSSGGGESTGSTGEIDRLTPADGSVDNYSAWVAAPAGTGIGIAAAGTGIGIYATSANISMGNPTSLPAIGGSVGPGGTRPVDSGAFMTLNHMIRVV